MLKREPYDFSCDLWSLGVISYALLCGYLPFDHKEDKEVARMTIEDDLDFDIPCWSKKSSLSKEFVSGLLEKEADQRMTLSEVIAHKWFKEKAH